jgi:hypothetical protein
MRSSIIYCGNLLLLSSHIHTKRWTSDAIFYLLELQNTELLLAIVDSLIDAAAGFLPTLLHLGLLDLLTDLLACEVTAIQEGTSSYEYEIFLAFRTLRKICLVEAWAFLYVMIIRVQAMCLLSQLGH